MKAQKLSQKCQISTISIPQFPMATLKEICKQLTQSRLACTPRRAVRVSVNNEKANLQPALHSLVGFFHSLFTWSRAPRQWKKQAKVSDFLTFSLTLMCAQTCRTNLTEWLLRTSNRPHHLRKLIKISSEQAVSYTFKSLRRKSRFLTRYSDGNCNNFVQFLAYALKQLFTL